MLLQNFLWSHEPEKAHSVLTQVTYNHALDFVLSKKYIYYLNQNGMYIISSRKCWWRVTYILTVQVYL